MPTSHLSATIYDCPVPEQIEPALARFAAAKLSPSIGYVGFRKDTLHLVNPYTHPDIEIGTAKKLHEALIQDAPDASWEITQRPVDHHRGFFACHTPHTGVFTTTELTHDLQPAIGFDDVSKVLTLNTRAEQSDFVNDKLGFRHTLELDRFATMNTGCSIRADDPADEALLFEDMDLDEIAAYQGWSAYSMLQVCRRFIDEKLNAEPDLNSYAQQIARAEKNDTQEN